MSLGATTRCVQPARLVPVRVHGVDVVRLDEVWNAGHFGEPLAAMAFDFVADDGFHLSSLLEEGVPGPELRTGYLAVATRDLLWQPRPERPCFWRVKGVARMLGSRRPGSGVHQVEERQAR